MGWLFSVSILLFCFLKLKYTLKSESTHPTALKNEPKFSQNLVNIFGMVWIKLCAMWTFSSVFQSCTTFATPWTAACQVSLSITNVRSLLKLMSMELVMPSNDLILCCPLLLLLSESGSFPMSQFFTSGGQSIEASASASVFPMNIQDWFPLRLTGLISLQSKGLWRVFFFEHHSSKASILWCSAFFIVQL